MQLRKLIQFILFLIPSLAWAAGGACPSGASYINWQSPLTPVTLSSLGVTSCYYVSAAGSDSNAGTSESSPWLHAPGMPAATGNPASLNPTGGIGIIFRGSDTWHFGNSSASPYLQHDFDGWAIGEVRYRLSNSHYVDTSKGPSSAASTTIISRCS